MSVELMLWLSLAVVVLPFVLMLMFNGIDQADARGRRISRRWRPARPPQ